MHSQMLHKIHAKRGEGILSRIVKFKEDYHIECAMWVAERERGGGGVR